MESKVTVLTPNGRRQNVKITPNTTLLKILEEVCQKQGFVSDDYTLRHHNKEVSLSQTFRFSGLPNNCLLEMSETDKKRVDAPVDICIQMEDGTRKQAQFKTADNLLVVVNHLCAATLESYESPVIIYMRQEIIGKEQMLKTNLKSLGILEGRALMRLVNKTVEELKTQAMVYAPPVSKTETKKNEDDDDKPKPSKTSSGGAGGFAITKDLVKSLKKAAETKEAKMDDKEGEEAASSSANAPQETKEPEKPKFDWGNAPGRSMRGSESKIETQEDENVEPEVIPEYHIIGERNALIYSLDATQSQVEDLPDSFYDLTVNDLKLVLKDLRKIATGDEDAPMLTEKLRDLETNNTMLRKISQYKNCAIRIQFPDRYVLQGMFKPIDTISDVMEFTKKFLNVSDLPCYLFTIPPKTKLELDKTLLEMDFVPNALIHFSLEDENRESGALIKQEFLQQLTDPAGALYAASKFRKEQKFSASNKNEKPQSVSPSTGAIPKRPRNDDTKKA